MHNFMQHLLWLSKCDEPLPVALIQTCMVCRLLKNPLEPERVQEIITEAVDIEKSFICDSLPVSTVSYALLATTSQLVTQCCTYLQLA